MSAPVTACSVCGRVDDEWVAYSHEFGENHCYQCNQAETRHRADNLDASGNGAAPEPAAKDAEGGDTALTALTAQADWPQPMRPEARHGLAGEVLRTIEPHTEADPHAVLVQFLAAFGSACGRAAGFKAEATFHGTNLYVLSVGETSKGRKGSSWQQASAPVHLADDTWGSRVVSGLSSGEGLIYAVRDPVEIQRRAKTKAEREEADADGYISEITDHGEDDKRALAIESEFASVLRVMRRDGSTLSPTIRQAWESDVLRTLTKNSPVKATGAHISIAGHIVQEELRRELLTTDMASGFANRFLFVCSRRSKLLPEGGNLTEEDWQEIVPELRASIRFAGTVGVMRRDDEARDLWAEVYAQLSEGAGGLYGAVTSRAEAQVMRLAVIYALLDCSPAIGIDHLRAALAVWDYCDASARYLFGGSLGDETADSILSLLRVAGADGERRNAIREHFGRHKRSGEIDRALALLEGLGRARREREETGGRPAEVWFVAESSCAISAKSAVSPPETGLTAHTAQPNPVQNEALEQPSENGTGQVAATPEDDRKIDRIFDKHEKGCSLHPGDPRPGCRYCNGSFS